MIDLTPFGAGAVATLFDSDDEAVCTLQATIADQRYVADLAMAIGKDEDFTLNVPDGVGGEYLFEWTGQILTVSRGEGDVVTVTAHITRPEEQAEAA